MVVYCLLYTLSFTYANTYIFYPLLRVKIYIDINRGEINMVKDATSRANKFANKLDSSVTKARIDAQKDTMIAGNATAMAETAQTQAQVRTILDDTPSISTTFSQPFMACALELGRKARKYTGQNLQSEGTYVLNKWASRTSNLTGARAKLVLIAGLFGITFS